MVSWQEEYLRAKYHLSIAQRLYHTYEQFREKRFLVGVIKENAKACSSIIRAYLVYHKKRRYKDFTEIISKQYLDAKTRENLMRILEVEKAQKDTPVQFARKETMILLIEGKYRFLKSERLAEFLESLQKAINAFPKR